VETIETIWNTQECRTFTAPFADPAFWVFQIIFGLCS